jgi:DNA-binding PadR family transcriptional regulator
MSASGPDNSRRPEDLPISVLGYALLSLLAKVPLSGYDLAREMRKPHAFFFGQGHVSQIYPELARLEAAGLISATTVEQQGKPDKKVYTLSLTGRDRLKAWVVAPTPILEVRSEFLIKAHSLWLVDATEALVQFRAHERYHRDQLAVYEQQLADTEQRWGADLVQLETPAFGDYLTVKRGVGYERECIAWLEWVIGLLEERAKHRQQGRSAHRSTPTTAEQEAPSPHHAESSVSTDSPVE